jgi:hypothetical protein
VLERVIDDWLSKTNERSLEIPFCQLLNAEGHQVVHLSRHGPYEEGKDIISIAPDGTPCAFQLKSGKITLKVWERHLDQIKRLVEIPIAHPSVRTNLPHRAFLVTNGELDEEVRIEIDHRNRGWQRSNYPVLETIVKHQLLRRFVDSSTNFFPAELQPIRSFLELFLYDGTACLDKAKFSGFIFSILPIDAKEPTSIECERALANAAIFATYALAPFTNAENHVALIEGWTVFAACLVAIVERFSLDQGNWRSTLEIATSAIELAFESLYHELKERDHLVEGMALVDAPFYRGRVTWLLGLISAHELWKQLRYQQQDLDTWAREFVLSKRNFIELWGEAAIPQILMIIWFLRQILSTPEPDFMLAGLIKQICQSSYGNQTRGLANPYKDLETVIAEINGFSESVYLETYAGRSYLLETLIHLYTRRNWHQQMRRLWPQVTYLEFAELELDEAWQFCLWRSEDYGKLVTKQPNLTQSWTELRSWADIVDTEKIPKVFIEQPELLLMFILVYPHRLTPNVGKLLDDQLKRVKEKS